MTPQKQKPLCNFIIDYLHILEDLERCGGGIILFTDDVNYINRNFLFCNLLCRLWNLWVPKTVDFGLFSRNFAKSATSELDFSVGGCRKQKNSVDYPITMCLWCYTICHYSRIATQMQNLREFFSTKLDPVLRGCPLVAGGEGSTYLESETLALAIYSITQT